MFNKLTRILSYRFRNFIKTLKSEVHINLLQELQDRRRREFTQAEEFNEFSVELSIFCCLYEKLKG